MVGKKEVVTKIGKKITKGGVVPGTIDKRVIAGSTSILCMIYIYINHTEMLECIDLHSPSIPIRILYRYTYLLLLWLYKALSQTFIESTKVSACNQSDSTVAF